MRFAKGSGSLGECGVDMSFSITNGVGGRMIWPEAMIYFSEAENGIGEVYRMARYQFRKLASARACEFDSRPLRFHPTKPWRSRALSGFS